MRGRAVPMMLAALSTYHAGMPQVVIVGEPGAPDTRALARVVHGAICRPPSSCRSASAHRRRAGAAAAVDRELVMRDGRATAYVCRNFACQMPTTSPAELETSARRHGILGRHLASRRQPRHHRHHRAGAAEPRAWTDADVAAVLAGMLRALDRAKNPDAEPDRQVALRGFSWIVSPFETGGVVIALEMTLGAVVAGPFDVAERDLTARIERVMGARRAPVLNGSLEPVGVQDFRREPLIERREALEQRIVQPVVRVDHVQIVARRQNPPEARLPAEHRALRSYWMLLTSEMNGENCVSPVKRYSVVLKFPSGSLTSFHGCSGTETARAQPHRQVDLPLGAGAGVEATGLEAWLIAIIRRCAVETKNAVAGEVIDGAQGQRDGGADVERRVEPLAVTDRH